MDYNLSFFVFLLVLITTTFGQTNNFEQLVDVRLGTIEAILNSLVSRMDAGFFQIDSKINTNLERVSNEQGKLQNQIADLKSNGVDNLGIVVLKLRDEVFEIKQNLNKFEPQQGLNKVLEETNETLQSINQTCSVVKEIVEEKFGQDKTDEINNTSIHDNYEKLQSKIESQAAESIYLLTKLKIETAKKGELCAKGNGSFELFEDFEQIPRRDEWIVIQSRGVFQHKPRIGFARVFAEYEKGFGKYDGDFWLGLNKIWALTSLGYTDLKIVIQDWNGTLKFAQYENFTIGDVRDIYRLNIGEYSGNAGDALGYHNGQQFTTVDSDNDPVSTENCSRIQGGNGGWWFKECLRSNLNGMYKSTGGSSVDGIYWAKWRLAYSFKASEMMVRIPKNLQINNL